jgi:WD40 repeat protein
MKRFVVLIAVCAALTGRLYAQNIEVYLQGHTGAVNAAVYSPDGKKVATASGDNTIKIWDAESGNELRTLTGHSESVRSLAISPDGRQIVSGSNDKTIKLWNMETGQEIRTITGHTGLVQSVAFSPDGKKLVSSGSSEKNIKIWDTGTGREIRTITTALSVAQVIYSPNGRNIALHFGWDGEYDNSVIKVIDAESGREIRSIHHGIIIDAIAYNSDGNRIASASWIDEENENVKIWNAETGAEIKTLSGIITDGTLSLAFSPNGRQIVAGLWAKEFKTWDTESGRELRTITGHSNNVNSVAYSPDNNRILSGSSDGTAKIWDAATGRELLSLSRNTTPVYRVALSPNGKRLASGSQDGIIRIWDIENGKMLQAITAHVFNGNNVPVFSVEYSADGRRILSGGDDDTIKIWNAETGRNIRTIQTGAGSALVASYSPDGRRILGALQDKCLKIWDAETGRELRTLTGHSAIVWAAAWSPDGKRIASGSDDLSIRLWDAETGREIRTVSANAHAGRVNMLDFSPDGKQMISSGANGVIGVWNAENGSLIKALAAKVASVAYNQDGKSVLAGLTDGSINVFDYYFFISSWHAWYDMAQPKLITGHRATVNHAIFSADGKFYASASSDGTVRVWSAEKKAEIAQFIGFAGNEWICLTPSNYYTASANGDQMVNARSGTTISGLDRYRSTLKNDTIVAAIISLGEEGSSLENTRTFSLVALPVTSAKAAAIQLGAIAYKDLQETRFLEPNNRDKITRYESILQSIKSKNSVSDAEIQNALRAGITAEVDAQFNRIYVNLNRHNAYLTRNSQTGQYTLSYEGVNTNNETRTITGNSVEALASEMRDGRQKADFTSADLNTVRAQAALIPAVVYADWKSRRIAGGTDALALVKETLENFYLNPTTDRYNAVRGIYARYIITETSTSDPFAKVAGSSFARLIDTLNVNVGRKIAADMSSGNVRNIIAIPNDPRYNIFTTPYSSSGGR